MSVSEYYSALKDTLHEFEVYQSLVIDHKTMRQYREDFTIAKFLSRLASSLLTQVMGQIFTVIVSHH